MNTPSAEALSNRCRYFHREAILLPTDLFVDTVHTYQCPDCGEMFFANHARGERKVINDTVMRRQIIKNCGNKYPQGIPNGIEMTDTPYR